MELTAALTAIAAQIGMDANQLIQYADDYQGDNERKVLNAIVRALRPVNCLELGTHTGEGTMCILAALTDKPEPKQITTVDISTDPIIGSAIPAAARRYITLIPDNIDTWIGSQSGYDFIFDDGSHSIHQVHQIYGHLDQLLNPGGIILSHDAAAGGVGEYIREGQTKSGYDLPVYVIDPAPWGFSVYRKPGWEVQPEPEEKAVVWSSPQTTVYDDGSFEVSGKHPLDDDLDAEVHTPVEVEDLPEPPKKKRGRPKKAAS